ncbi:hypothetical protein Salat_1120900 [Sesamum alatum]|uniref:Uncharacterized protein n=1 Tax=Sesamum alatum TaxID=300844 RepID=A0AAE1YNN6_9LAMI|nr:hypothetical protein Salat_1120900 [Sesamum alatum]
MANDEPPLDDIVNGDGSAVVSCPSSKEDALNRLLSEFNLSEFLALANRVIDEGDLASMEAISDLKRRWTEKIWCFSVPSINGCTSFLIPHSCSFSTDYGSY